MSEGAGANDGSRLRLPSCYFAAPKNAVKSERCLSGGALAPERVLELRHFCSEEKATERNSEAPFASEGFCPEHNDVAKVSTIGIFQITNAETHFVNTYVTELYHSGSRSIPAPGLVRADSINADVSISGGYQKLALGFGYFAIDMPGWWRLYPVGAAGGYTDCPPRPTENNRPAAYSGF